MSQGASSGFLAATLVTIYLLPMVIAIYRDHHQTLVITWINLLWGWSGIGWLFAFFWALTAVQVDPHALDEPQEKQKKPPKEKPSPAWPLPPR